MKKGFRVFALVTSLAVTSSVLADEMSDFKKWYTAETPKMVKAMESKNIKFFEACSAPTFTYTTADGKKTDKKASMAGLKSMMDTMKTVKYTYKIGPIKAEKGGISVELMNDYKMTTMPGPDKKTHVMTMKQKTKEMWSKMKGKWMLMSITDIGQGTMTMDGKAFDPSKMGG